MKKNIKVKLAVSVVALFVVFMLIAYVVWGNIKNRVIDGCGFSGGVITETTNGYYKYKINDKSVCYHEACSFYDGIDYHQHLCNLDETLFGYKKLKNADSNTFVYIPEIFAGVDINGVYFTGNQQAKSLNPSKLAHFMGTFLNFCEKKAYVDSNYQTDGEKINKLCKLVQESFSRGKERN